MSTSFRKNKFNFSSDLKRLCSRDLRRVSFTVPTKFGLVKLDVDESFKQSLLQATGETDVPIRLGCTLPVIEIWIFFCQDLVPNAAPELLGNSLQS